MSREKRGRFRSRLSAKLLLSAGLSLVLAFFAMLGINFLLSRQVDQSYEGIAQKYQRAAQQDLQAYIDQNGLSMGDTEALDLWRNGQKQLLFFLYRSDGSLFYDSTLERGGSVPSQDEDYFYTGDGYVYNLRFSDGVAYAFLYSYAPYAYYNIAGVISILAALILFIVLFYLLVQKKINYIASLKDELKILEGGDLHYSIRVEGNDELGELAQGIEDMRLAILERQEGEEAAYAANRELIAAMSHDLRTPLTSLLGYLDLLAMGKYGDIEQAKHFIESSREKGYRIKALSDKLFEYFLVFSTDWADTPTEELEACGYLSQMLAQHAFDLESGGFRVESNIVPFPGCIRVAVELMQRVFENLFGNIAKYGDRTKPVRIACAREGGLVGIRLENAVSPEAGGTAGTHIGLKTCAEILRFHGGRFSAARQGEGFEACLWIPLEQKRG